MQIEFDTSGPKRLLADISEAEPRNKARLSRALRKTAHDIEADAKVFAPVDTGALKNSISTDATSDGFHAEVGPTVDYAHYVENGTSKMSPQPYLRPAADRRLPRLRRAVLDIGGDIL